MHASGCTCAPGAGGAESVRSHGSTWSAGRTRLIGPLLCFTHGQEVMSVPVTWETETVAKIPRQWVLVSEPFPRRCFAQTLVPQWSLPHPLHPLLAPSFLIHSSLTLSSSPPPSPSPHPLLPHPLLTLSSSPRLSPSPQPLLPGFSSTRILKAQSWR